MTNISTERLEEHCCFICEAPFKEGEMVLIDVTEGLGQEEGAAGLAERLSDWRARGVSGEDADAAASALLSQSSQIEALRKERDEARLCQQQIAAGSNQSATVARIIIAKNEADGRAEAAETKLAEAINKLRENGIDFDPETA